MAPLEMICLKVETMDFGFWILKRTDMHKVSTYLRLK